MINSYTFRQLTENTLSVMDPEQFPEIYDYLSEFLEEGVIPPGPYDTATMVVHMDEPAVFPPFMVEYIAALYELEIEEGNTNAMNDLGAAYYDGHRGFEQSFAKAVHYYKMAARNGNRQAQENLAYCYYYGRDMEKDYEKAFHYFALGAFDGHLISLYKIGDMYLNGYYVEKNEKEAFVIYMRCLETMTEEAEKHVAGPVYLRLGKMFLNGLGVEADPKSALVCYQKAESFLYDMVKGGDVMYKGSLRAAIKGQEEARAKLAELLPQREWVHD